MMLAILKKNKASANREAGTPWRTDFREVQLLPDTKTVRTTFMVSVILFTILGSLILFITFREVTVAGLKKEILAVEVQIASASAPNAAAESNYKLFQSEEAKLKSVQAWAISEFSFPDYLIHLASLMPAGVRANSIEFRGFPQNILVRGSIDGQDAAASETASAFIDRLQNDEKFKKLFSSVVNVNLGRNAAAETLSFELLFTFPKPAAPKK